MTEVVSQCNFCGQPRNLVEHLFTTSTANICNDCLDICNEILADDPEDLSGTIYTPQCSFCGKSEQEVERLIPGAQVCICNECIKTCEESPKPRT